MLVAALVLAFVAFLGCATSPATSTSSTPSATPTLCRPSATINALLADAAASPPRKNFLPLGPTPDGLSLDDYLVKLSNEGLMRCHYR